MNTKISCLFLLVCGTLPWGYSNGFFLQSVKSDVFESVRPKHPPKSISECDTVVTEPYGLLEKTYKRGQAKEDESCSWTLRAPANHVVNVISVASDLLDNISSEKHEDYSGSFISLYDDADTSRLMFSFRTGDYSRASSVFTESISNKQDILVKVDYHDIKGYATQKIAVKYEFLDVNDVNRLLRAN